MENVGYYLILNSKAPKEYLAKKSIFLVPIA